MHDSTQLPAFLRRLAVILALAVVAVAFWWWRILAPAPVSGPIGFLCGDLYTSYIPVLARVAGDLRGGHLPLWNPDQLAGVPTLPSWFAFGAFYPLNVLFLFLPAHVALGWTACMHLALAGSGMYWLARTLELSPLAAWLAAVTYMLSLPLAAAPNLFIAMTLAPAVLASFVRLTKRPGHAAVALAATLLALQFSGGGTQILVYTLYALALLLPFILVAVPRRDRSWRTLAYPALAVTLALGLVAVLLLPTTTAMELSTRATGRLSLAETLPFPTRTLSELGRELLDPTPGLPRVFFGWSALALALCGISRPTPRGGWAGVVLILVVGTLLVLGPNTPAYAWYYRLPTGDWFRSPERAAMLMSIGVALLAAHGLDRLRRRALPANSKTAAPPRRRTHPPNPLLFGREGGWKEKRGGQGVSSLLRRRGWRAIAVVLAVLPMFELFRATSNWLPYPQVRSPEAMAPPATLAHIRSALGDGRLYIARNWEDRFPFTEKLGTWQKLAVAQDYDSLTPAVYGDYFRALLGAEALVDPIFTGRYHPAFGNFTARRALDLLAVNLIVIAPGAEVRWLGTRSAVPAGAEPRLLRNRWALPRAYIVHRVVAVEDEQQAFERLKDLTIDPTSTAVVVGGEAIDVPPRADSGASRVEVTSAGTDEVILRARMDRPGLLVLNDLVFPGWEARVDSQPTPIFRTNGLFRGVYLDSGEHVVEFVYRAPGLVLGSWVTGVSLVVLVIMAVPRRRQRGPV